MLKIYLNLLWSYNLSCHLNKRKQNKTMVKMSSFLGGKCHLLIIELNTKISYLNNKMPSLNKEWHLLIIKMTSLNKKCHILNNEKRHLLIIKMLSLKKISCTKTKLHLREKGEMFTTQCDIVYNFIKLSC